MFKISRRRDRKFGANREQVGQLRCGSFAQDLRESAGRGGWGQTRRVVFCALAAGLLAVTGCRKAEAPPPAETIQMAGVSLDLPKLDTEFQNASPEVKTAVIQIKTLFRGGRLAQMVTELDKLGNNPSLTDSQKKLINGLIQQVGQVIAKIPTPPG